jgi:hypothetical protein
VSKIGDSAFAGCSELKSVIIPTSGVTEIGSCAFAESGLISITIPKDVLYIGSEAFFGCKNLTSVKIVNGETKQGDDLFVGCTSLIRVTLDGNPVGFETTHLK